jgi:hypothetical protein
MFKAIQRKASRGLCELPTFFHVSRDGDKIVGVEVASNTGIIWAWPRGFRSGLKNAQEQGGWGKWDMKAIEADRWNLVPLGQAL